MELYHFFFLNFGMVPEAHMKLCVTAGFSEKIFFCYIICKNGPEMGQKQGFSNLLKDWSLLIFTDFVLY